jgi:hypothetical protein
LDDFEITCVIKDESGIISHCGVKGFGIQNVGLIERLISEEACSFFIYEGEKKMNIYARTSLNGTPFLTTDPHGFDINGLNYLPLFDGPFLRQLLDSAR